MKREEKKRLNILINKMINDIKNSQKNDLQALRKPYNYKGRFNSLSNKEKRAKIREHYAAKIENLKIKILNLLTVEDLREFQSSVEWVNSSTWGANPHARAWVNGFNYGEGKASGCGYDKLSAAICCAVNDNAQSSQIIKAAILKKHITTGEPIPYGVYISNDIYLHFDGCGLSTILNIMKYCGLVRQVANSGKMSDFIHCEK